MDTPTAANPPPPTTSAPPAEPSYIDYEAFLSPSFSPRTFANTLVRATNNPTDTPLDLSTPLSRVLFDTQEIDAHIDALATRAAGPLLAHTATHTAASRRILAALQGQLDALRASHAQLVSEVGAKHAAAEEVRCVVVRLWGALRLGRAVGRALLLGRLLEAQWAELFGGVEGEGLERVDVVTVLREGVVVRVEGAVRETAERVVREFSVGSAAGSATFAQSEEVRARTVSALTALYLLTPVGGKAGERWAPVLMLQALEVYLRSALQSSIAALARALGTLPSLERTLAEVSARCQNVVALESVLEGTKVPAHPLVHGAQGVATAPSGNMLQPLLAYLETGSLASYFWRTMASSMAPRVQEIVAKGGVSVRTLKSNRQSVSDAIRECVVRGSQLPNVVAAAAAKGRGKAGGTDAGGKHWDREVAVMVGSVVNNLGR
ncbi:hypothetical protein BT67DRAFT_491089 [Trichocladium antarcticum]|uniref:Conserved oligomeric Golgi complex subunit 5 n=1 Tax=Trichocladium antarcticum TaxID=1450529 RepID=A0AAN6ZFI7_9PEZI|nr:hypothetical protein BT67DRAFT_491089 [Trichocladium antarcticum]